MISSNHTRYFATAALLFTACVTPGCGSSDSTGSGPSAGGTAGNAGSGGSGESSNGGSSIAGFSNGGSAGSVSTGGDTSTFGGASGAGVGGAAGSEAKAGNAGVSAGGASGSGAAGASGSAGAGAGGASGSAGAGAGGASGSAGAGGGNAGSGGAGGSAGAGGASGSAGAGGSGGAGACQTDNMPCSNNAGDGICESQVCAACAEDPSCVTAYGAGNLCISGSCTPADCRTNTDCAGNANGSICGATEPGFCGKCTIDTQCGASNMCNPTSGKCVANSCTGTDTACTQNPSDVCCTTTCVPGACCDDTICKTRLGSNAVCSNHTCTTCDAITGANPVYLVDPIGGNDGSATGKGTSGGTAVASCSFATITRALQAIGPNPATGTVIKVIGASTVPTAANTNTIKEVFPITIPTNVTITAGTGLVTVKPPNGGTAFALGAPASGIDGTLGGGTLVIDGSTHTALNGVAAEAGSTDGTILKNVTIQNFMGEGVTATGTAILSIGQGVTVTGNGFGRTASGMHVSGNAHVGINVASGAPPALFTANAQHGILVNGNGSLSVLGIQSGGTGTVECLQNAVSGLAIAQTPALATAQNTINGLVVVGTTGGNGIRIEAGSKVNISNSYSLGNVGSGILVTTSVIGRIRNNDVSNVVLGTTATAGNNTFQASVGSNPNQGAGICLALDVASGTLMARGNLFSKAANCAATAAVLSFSNTGCGADRDLGLIPQAGSTAGNDIDVMKCTHP
jgi:hypothetical protein